jgi:ArsR family transcriptional regulator
VDIAQLFKGLSDPVRLRIFHALAVKGELCVCHLTDALVLPQSTISRHLSVLKNVGLVDAEREGKWVYYSPVTSNQQVCHLIELIKAEGITNKQFQEDLIAINRNIC